MKTTALIMNEPRSIKLLETEIHADGPDDVVVDVLWSGVSTGTEKLLWEGTMPNFPGMGYPLVPGYESVGRVITSNSDKIGKGELVFVPGAACYADVRALFGATASRVVVNGARVYPVSDTLGKEAVLLALAATAYHALAANSDELPGLIIGHGVLGRLLARITIALGGNAPTVWEKNPGRTSGAQGYKVTNGESDARADYAMIVDASGDANILDSAVGRLAKAGEIVLAGFYANSLSFAFAPAFMREARFRIAAEFKPIDVHAVLSLIAENSLSLDGLISDEAGIEKAEQAYQHAFNDASCTKLVLNWNQAL